MKRIRLNVSSVSVASFTTMANREVGKLASFVTNDPSCWAYCGPDDQNTGPTVPGSGC